jgi:hypothetical protein
VWPKVRTLLPGWVNEIPHPWREPEGFLPDPSENGFWAYLRDMPALHGDARVAVPQPLGERGWWLEVGTHDPMVLPGWHYAERRDYSVNSYGKPTLFLHCLRGLLGEAAFDRILRSYAEAQRFRHPTTSDFLAAVAAGTPEEQRALVDGFVEAMAFGASQLDVAILSAEEREVKAGDATRYEWTVRVQRRGAIPVPITVTVEDEGGGSTLLGEWTSRDGDTTRTFRTVQDKRMRVVRIGPDWLRNLDRDLSNNARRTGPADHRPAAVLAARWALYAEEVLRTYGGVAR